LPVGSIVFWQKPHQKRSSKLRPMRQSASFLSRTAWPWMPWSFSR
jgi:hypothetical protein